MFHKNFPLLTSSHRFRERFAAVVPPVRDSVLHLIKLLSDPSRLMFPWVCLSDRYRDRHRSKKACIRYLHTHLQRRSKTSSGRWVDAHHALSSRYKPSLFCIFQFFSPENQGQVLHLIDACLQIKFFKHNGTRDAAFINYLWGSVNIRLLFSKFNCPF